MLENLFSIFEELLYCYSTYSIALTSCLHCIHQPWTTHTTSSVALLFLGQFTGSPAQPNKCRTVHSPQEVRTLLYTL